MTLPYNIMTCTAKNGSWSTSFLGDCSMVWFSFAIILFLILILRRQCQDGILAGTGFNFIGALVGGLGCNLLITTLFGSAKWSLLAGIAGIVVGGYFLGMFSGSSDSGGYG